jgi:hypothetical protein
MVYGEHPETDAQYIADSMKAVYSVRVPTKHGFGQQRFALHRKQLKEASIDVFEHSSKKERCLDTFSIMNH